MSDLLRENEIKAIKGYIEEGQYDKAVKHIEALLKENPKDPNSHYYLGLVYLSKKDYESARLSGESALSYGFNPALCYEVIGTSYREQKQFKQGEEAYKKALAENPGLAKIHASYGYLLLLTGFEDKALEHLNHALKIDSSSSEVNDYVTKFYFVKVSRKNQKYIQQIMEEKNSDLKKLVNLAMMHELNGEIIKAKDVYRKALKLDPQNENLRLLINYINEKAHPMYLPHRIVERIGGPGILWVIVMIILFIVYYMTFYVLAIAIAISYILFVVYSWKTPQLYKRFVKGRR